MHGMGPGHRTIWDVFCVWVASLLKMRQGASRQEREFSFLSAGHLGLGRIRLNYSRGSACPFAWKVVRQHDGYTYFENAVTGRRSHSIRVIMAD